MNFYGIVCEFNPFHDGHRYLIQKTRELTGTDAIVCVMSGSMVQRGDVAVFDKWQRAASAVKNGADLVVELPVGCVLQSADKFAEGAVSLLNDLGASGISFGCECDNTELLTTLADIRESEPDEYKTALKAALDAGRGYPSACEEAIRKCMPDIEEEAFGPNSTLAAAYIKAARRLNGKMKFNAVKRIGEYHSTDLNVSYPSATAIREKLLRGEGECNCDIYDISRIAPLILGFFRLADEEELKDICSMEQGLAKRMIKAAGESASVDEFVSKCVTKRYTAHRIRRVMLCALLGIKQYQAPEYARVLAIGGKGAQILKEAKKSGKTEIITKIQKNKISEMLRQDILATDIASLCCGKKSGADFLTTPFII